jgi:3-phenylpropionate/trans-cinnamate dioxygenase ferredoxin subunit
MVIGTVIECPLHQGRFDVICVNLKTYPVKLEDGAVWVEI